MSHLGPVRQAFTDRFYPRSYQDAKIEEFFRLEQRSLTVTEYQERFLELVKLVPMRNISISDSWLV